MKPILVTLQIISLAGFALSQAVPAKLTLQEALESTISLHPQGKIRTEQVAASLGALREASGLFDPVLFGNLQQRFDPLPLSNAQIGPGGPKSAALNTTTFTAGTTRLYRNGITAGPIVELDRSRDRLSSAAGINRSRIAYELAIPLLRNRGKEVVAARDRKSVV